MKLGMIVVQLEDSPTTYYLFPAVSNNDRVCTNL